MNTCHYLRRLTSRFFLLVTFLSYQSIAVADPGTAQDRAALFDYILEATLARTAFSPFKIANIGATGYDSIEDLVTGESLKLRDEIVAADTDEKLFYALQKLSSARWDSHLHVYPVEGGIELDDYNPGNGGKIEDWTPHAQIKFKPDFGDPDNYRLFISDFATSLTAGGSDVAPQIGDILISVNGVSAADYLAKLSQYHGKSSLNSLWWDLAYSLPLKTWFVDPSLYDDNISLKLERADGHQFEMALPYARYDSIDWAGHDDLYTDITRVDYVANREGFAEADVVRSARKYPGFEHLFSTPGYDGWVNEGKKTFLLQWNQFQRDIRADVQELVDYASANDKLDYAVIWDGTASRGGSHGVWILQRLQDQPYRITFGNLRISDTTQALSDELRSNYVAKIAAQGRHVDVPTVRSIVEPDNGQFLLDWLDNDLAKAITDVQAYSSNVPFKNYYLPTYADGIVHPAEVHFTGPLVLLVGPAGCSQVDQFVSMVVDNDLGFSVGMKSGGCSNTWEWEEDLEFPISGKPVARYMWSVGHTIRPNSEVLEGNSSPVDVYIPLTSTNYLEYNKLLLDAAYIYIEDQRR